MVFAFNLSKEGHELPADAAIANQGIVPNHGTIPETAATGSDDAITCAGKIIQELRTKLQTALSPSDYTQLVAKLAYLLDANRDNAALWKELFQIISDDKDKKVRMLVAIAYGFEGSTMRKLEIGKLLLKEKDPEVMLAFYHSIRSPDPLHYRAPPGRYEQYTFDTKDPRQYALYVQDELLPISCFYTTTAQLERDYKIEPFGDETRTYSAGSKWMSYFAFSYFEPEVGRLILEFASDKTVPNEIRHRVFGDFMTYPESFPDGFVQDVFNALQTSDDPLVLGGLRSRAIGSENNAFDRRWIETVHCLAASLKRESEILKESHYGADSIAYDFAGFLGKSDRYDYALQFLEENPELSRCGPGRVKKAIEDEILTNTEKYDRGADLWGVQKRILISRQTGNAKDYAESLAKLWHDPEGFVVSEAKKLLAKESERETRRSALHAIGENGTLSDIPYLESLAPIDNEDQESIMGTLNYLKGRIGVK